MTARLVLVEGWAPAVAKCFGGCDVMAGGKRSRYVVGLAGVIMGVLVEDEIRYRTIGLHLRDLLAVFEC